MQEEEVWYQFEPPHPWYPQEDGWIAMRKPNCTTISWNVQPALLFYYYFWRTFIPLLCMYILLCCTVEINSTLPPPPNEKRLWTTMSWLMPFIRTPRRHNLKSVSMKSNLIPWGLAGDYLLTVCLLLTSGIEPNPGPDTPRVGLPTPWWATHHASPPTNNEICKRWCGSHAKCTLHAMQPTTPWRQHHHQISNARYAVNRSISVVWKRETTWKVKVDANKSYLNTLANSSTLLSSSSYVTHASRTLFLSYKTTSLSPCGPSNTNLTYFQEASLAPQLIRTVAQQPARQKASFAETTTKAVVRQIEQSNRLLLQTTHPSPSPSGIANEVWRHIERCQTMLLSRSGVYKRGGDGTLVGGLPRHITGLDVPLLILMRCRFNKDIICLLTWWKKL